MVLLGSLAHAQEQFVILLDERRHQRAVLFRNQGKKMGEGRAAGLVALLSKVALSQLAIGAGRLDGGALLIDGRNGIGEVIRSLKADQFLLMVQERKHFAILLKLIP